MAKKDMGKKALALHKKLRGKVRIQPALKIKDRADLSLIYTPGVAAVSSAVAKNNKLAHSYTIKGRMVAVLSDGSAVLGLGNIGALGALPVMEGKCALFKKFAGVDAFPLVLDTQEPDEIVETIVRLAPAFGGINLEDIAAPKCFYIEEQLKKRLDIPVFHDDQHGTAIAVLAALYNAARVVKKDFKKLRVVIAGSGAAGSAVAKLLHKAGVKHTVMLDRNGIVSKHRRDLSPHKQALLKHTNPNHLTGRAEHALRGADVLIGVSGPNLFTAADVALMGKKAIVFAMANPVPEISPEEARRGGAVVVGTGRSDYPNQINNSLVFPGIFKGALARGVNAITDEMKLRAAKNLAALVKKPTAQKIVPGPFEKGVSDAVAKAIR
jgi:malate dehydrogenase (oxaloacetate-decarboxylating)